MTEINVLKAPSQFTCKTHHTDIAPDLQRAYWETNYPVICGEDTWILRPGQRHADFDRWLAETFSNACFWSIITAWNPYSQTRSREENIEANVHLASCLQAAGYLCLPARGEPRSGDWHPEESWFVPELDAQAACDWGKRYQQNAVLWGRRGEKAQLLACATGAKLQLPDVPDAHARPGHSPPRQA